MTSPGHSPGVNPILLAGWLIVVPATSPAQGGQETVMTDQQSVLATSEDPRELLRTALLWSVEEDPGIQGRLLNFLTSLPFLQRLDSPQDYRDAAAFRLRVSRLVESLARNQSPAARGTFDALLNDPVFTADVERIEALLRASEFVRPPTPGLTGFWRRYSRPDDGYVHVTVTALLNNGSEPALAVFAQLLLDEEHDPGDKVAWLHGNLLPHRDEPVVLEMARGLVLGGQLPAQLERALLESLFDYRPGEWYRPASVVSPPDRSRASPRALELLRDIGSRALTRLPPDDPLAEVVKAELAAIDDRLNDKP